MTHSINLSFDKGSLISVYIEGEIESVGTNSEVVGEVSRTTTNIALAQCASITKPFQENRDMPVLHRIKLPAGYTSDNVPSDLGDWECCADEVHSFYAPMVQLSLAIDADHTLHMFCEADQVEAAVAMLRGKLLLAGESCAASSEDPVSQRETSSLSGFNPSQKFHAELRDAMYASASKYSITGFEAAGAMFQLASEICATTLVIDGLLKGGPDFVDDSEAQP
jgi:hypothetical protein